MNNSTNNEGAASESNNDSLRHILSTNAVDSLEARVEQLERAIVSLLAAPNPLDSHGVLVSMGDHLPQSFSTDRPHDGVLHQLKRIADHFDPPPPDLVGSTYIADRLGCTPVWVAEMARRGLIPASCVVQGTGNGKPWKFLRIRIDEWLKKR